MTSTKHNTNKGRQEVLRTIQTKEEGETHIKVLSVSEHGPKRGSESMLEPSKQLLYSLALPIKPRTNRKKKGKGKVQADLAASLCTRARFDKKEERTSRAVEELLVLPSAGLNANSVSQSLARARTQGNPRERGTQY